MSTRNPSVNWVERGSFSKRHLKNLERLSLVIEKPVSRWVREGKFNPLYHTGTITVLLLFIILVTGIYLTMFYQFGFEASYLAVSKIEANFVGRVMRALHRYASDVAVIFALLHGWRTFFQDRFRGPRWLAWTTGIGMAAFVWLIGISGYWLIWDERASLLNQTLINLINNSQLGTTFLVRYLVTESAGTGWVFLVLVITIHLGLSAVVGVAYWLHIKRLSRAKWLPPNYWTITVTGLLVLASKLVPVGMLNPIDPTHLPNHLTIDSFYLFYLPGALNWPTILFWGGAILLITLIGAGPWLLTRKKYQPVVIDQERCTGCTLCASDCPYKAIQMIERSDDHKHRYLAVIDHEMCVACGICIGTCAPLAMRLGDKLAEPLWEDTLATIFDLTDDTIKVVFTCERHAYQNLEKITDFPKVENQRVHIVPLTCVGMAHPDLAIKALEKGAAEVHFIGCPPDDCANREGNLWLQYRLDRKRLPKLKSNYIGFPIHTDWLPPNDFSQAIENPNTQKEATGHQLELSQIKWRNFFPAVLLLGVVLIIQIWMSDLPFYPYHEGTALLEISLDHQAGYPIKESTSNLEPEPGLIYPSRLVLDVDGKNILNKSYPPKTSNNASLAFEQFQLDPGVHHIQLSILDRPTQIKGLVLYDQTFDLGSHEVLKLNFQSEQLNGDPVAGERLFNNRSIGKGGSCSLCHSLVADVVLIGPSQEGVAIRAEKRVAKISAEEYIKESILEPDAYIVEGYPSGQMLPDLDEKLTPKQIDDLVAFLMTMK
ncbi:hydrogenase iron-sulfur subunit [Chloroflexota bacterium]